MNDSVATSKYVYPNLTKTPTKNSQTSKVFNRPWSSGYNSHYYGGLYGGAGYYNPYGYGHSYGGYPHGYGYGYGYGKFHGYHHPWAYNSQIHMMGKKNWRAMFQPPEPIDPVYKYLDPISVSLQERVKRGGHINAEVETPLQKPVKYLFELKLIGDPNLSQNPAAKIAAEVEKHDRRYHKKKVYNRISFQNIKTGSWGCGKGAVRATDQPHGPVADIIKHTAQYNSYQKRQ